MAGPSGVGKSSLINKLINKDYMETGSLSVKNERGKNTTRHAELLCIEESTYIMDTPGFTSLDMPVIEPLSVRKLFPEFRGLTEGCRYSDCMHINEPDCAVKEALEQGDISRSRYESYLTMTEEVKKWQK